MTHSRKSAAQRAKSLERLKAHQEMKAAAIVRPAPPAPPPPAPRASGPAPPVAPPVPFKSPERLAWDMAYAGPGELGPVGGTWPNDGRHIPRMVWRLGFHSGSSRPTPPRN